LHRIAPVENSLTKSCKKTSANEPLSIHARNIACRMAPLHGEYEAEPLWIRPKPIAHKHISGKL
jgi:hypothetical protein